MQQPLPFNRDAGRKTTATIECSKSMVGRVIGKNGDTIKALQNYTGSLIQVNQVDDPCQITISGTQQSLSLAMSMVADIVRGTFKGFALLRQLAGPPLHQQHALPRPIYAPGYGLIPSTQFFGADGLPRDSAEGAIPISAIDPAALMGWSGMGVPEPWQPNNGMDRVIAQQQQIAYGLPSLPPNFNPYGASQGIPQQSQFRGGPANPIDPYGLAALYARQGMNQQDAFLAASGGYQDLGPLLAAASANAPEDQSVMGGSIGLRGGMGPMAGGNVGGNMGGNVGGRMMQQGVGGMGGQISSQPHLQMMDQASNGNWIGYPPANLNPSQIINTSLSASGVMMPQGEGGPAQGALMYAAKAEEEERKVLAISQAQQQLQAVSDLMAKAKLSEDTSGDSRDFVPRPQGDFVPRPQGDGNSNAMTRDAEGNYYFNNASRQGVGISSVGQGQGQGQSQGGGGGGGTEGI